MRAFYKIGMRPLYRCPNSGMAKYDLRAKSGPLISFFPAQNWPFLWSISPMFYLQQLCTFMLSKVARKSLVKSTSDLIECLSRKQTEKQILRSIICQQVSRPILVGDRISWPTLVGAEIKETPSELGREW